MLIYFGYLERGLIALVLLGLAGCASASGDQGNNESRPSLDLAQYQDAAAIPILELRSFFQGQRRGALSLSPDGGYIAFLQREERGGGVYLLTIANEETRRVSNGGPGMRFLWAPDSSGFFVDTPDAILFYDLNAADLILVYNKNSDFETVALRAHPADASLLVRERLDGQWVISSISLDGTKETIFQSESPITGQVFSQSGQLEYVKILHDETQRILYLAENGAREIIECDAIDVCELIASDHEGHLVMMSDRGGDLRALVTFDPGTAQIRDRLADPRGIGDLVSVTWDDAMQAPIFLGFAHNPGGHVFQDSELADLVHREIDDLSQSSLELQGNASSQTYLLSVSDASSPTTRFYYVNQAELSVENILPENSTDAGSASRFLRKTSFSYAASDGLEIHGFLTIPTGRDLSGTPIIVRVHGGPWARARNEYDPVVQIWANRGYVIFEPNFRGSTGYGRAFRAAAEADFGLDGRVHQDVVDGVIALRNQGIGTDAPVAITGHSYGGYSSYVGLLRSSDIFSAAISESGPADIGPSLLAAASGEDPNTGLPRRNRLRLDGVDVGADEYFIRLSENSPRASAERIEGGVLIFGGGNDELVPSEELRSYAEMLAAQGTDVTFLLDPDSGHELESPGMRQSYIFLTEAFLAYHLGGARSDSIPPPILDFVERYTVVGDPTADWIASE